jgi:hypothetical protein
LALGAWPALTSAGTDPSNRTTTVTLSQQKTLDANPELRMAYEAAAENTRYCLETEGIDGTTLTYDAAGNARFDWSGFSERSEAQASGEVFKSCYFEQFDDIDRAWQQSGPATEAAVERGWAMMRCIEVHDPAVRFPQDELGVIEQMLALYASDDPGVQGCISEAGTTMVAFTPLARCSGLALSGRKGVPTRFVAAVLFKWP